jgi:O-antigen/teichoic acid export membrane protein
VSVTSPTAEEVIPVAALPHRKRRLLQRVAAYSAARGVTEGLFGIRSILLATVLGPVAFGGWALLRLSMRYASFAGLGVFRGMELELMRSPEADGGGSDGARAAAGAALGFILSVSGALAATAVVASFLIHEPQVAMVLQGFAAAVILEQVYTYALIWTRVRTNLRRYATLEITNAALQAVFTAAFAAVWGLPGAFVGLACASATAILVTSSWVEFRPALRFAPLARLLRVGVPVAISMILGTALSTGDRWVVAGFGGARLLGYYAFAASVAGLAASFAWVVRTVVFPDVYGEARRIGAAAALKAHFERAVLPFARLYPPLLGLLSCMLGPAIALVMPKYLPAVAPARLFLLSGGAAGLVSLGALGTVAAGRQRSLPAISGSALLVTLALSMLAIRSGAGLEAVAAASFAGQLIYAGCVLWLNFRESGVPEPSRFLVLALTPLLWSTASALLIGRLLPGLDLESGALGALAYLVLLAPLAPAMIREWHKLRS